MSKYKAAVFDLDGTLTESLKSIAYTVNRTFKEFGIEEIGDLERFKLFVGDGARVLIEKSLKFRGIEDEKKTDEVFSRYLEVFEEGCLYELTECPGMIKFVQDLKQRGFKLAVLSNKPDYMTKKCVYKVFGETVFDEVRGQREGVPRKPDPTAALDIAAGFGVAPEECLYFGDTNTDMKTGKNAGMFTIGVLWGFRDEQELIDNHADLIISSPDEVAERVII